MKGPHFLKRYILLFPFLLFFLMLTDSAFSYDLPPINLGFTSFLDGMPPAGAGFYYENYTQFYTANRLMGNKGRVLPLPETGAQYADNLFQLVYLSPCKIGNVSIGFDFLEPLLFYSQVQDGLGNTVLRTHNGLGDLLFGPILQFDPIKYKDGSPLFVQRLEFDFIAPTGCYNRHFALQPSSHFWSFNPYWAATLWFSKKFAASTRVHYLYNWKNNSPNVAFGPGINSTQAGQAVWANFTMEYNVTKIVWLGVNGYALTQFTDTKANNSNVSGRRERVFAIGPGVLFNFSKDHNLFFNSYFETYARNRPQGQSLILRYVYHFC